MSCSVCGGESLVPTYGGLVACKDCTHMMADLDPAVLDRLHDLYAANYFNGDEYGDYTLEERSLKRNLRKRMRAALRHLPRERRQSAFEIGCAYGYFLEVAQEEFETVTGVDIAAEAVAAAQARWLPAQVQDFLDEGFSIEPVDAIFMWDTIEHLAQPRQFLDKIHHSLRPGGVFACTTGDIGSWLARHRKQHWRMIHPPTHVQYFTRESLTTLVTLSGLRTLAVSYPGVNRSVEGIAHGLLALGRTDSRLFESVQRTGLLRGSVYLNTRDIMFAIARRPASAG